MTSIQLREIFLELIKETRKTCLVVTHNIREAIEIGQRMIVLGKLSRNLLDEKIPNFFRKEKKVNMRKGFCQLSIEIKCEVTLLRNERFAKGAG